MDELITKQQVIDVLYDMPTSYDEYEDALMINRGNAVLRIEQLPPVAPKRRTGKWIPADSQCGIRCSVCGVPVDDFCHSIDYIDLDYEPNFCPNCGEMMT